MPKQHPLSVLQTIKSSLDPRIRLVLPLHPVRIQQLHIEVVRLTVGVPRVRLETAELLALSADGIHGCESGGFEVRVELVDGLTVFVCQDGRRDEFGSDFHVAQSVD